MFYGNIFNQKSPKNETYCTLFEILYKTIPCFLKFGRILGT